MQFGFRKFIQQRKLTAIEEIKSSLDNGGVVGGVFLDLKKAFDTVNHNVVKVVKVYFFL